jgi:2-oxoglutarate ferredoxin oxidoreductase subunit delta
MIGSMCFMSVTVNRGKSGLTSRPGGRRMDGVFNQSGMYMAEINLNLERCKGCGLCIGACPIDNLRISGTLNRQGVEPAEVIEPQRCTGCGQCYRICPDMAIEIIRTPSKAGSEVTR